MHLSILGSSYVECLEHPSLMYLYSYVEAVVLAVFEVSNKNNNLSTYASLEMVCHSLVIVSLLSRVL